MGHYIYNFIQNENINTDYVFFEEYHQTGIQFKNKVSKGDAYAPYFRNHSAATKLSINKIKCLDITQFDHIHITGISLAISPSFRNMIYHVIDVAQENNITISFDPNIREEMWDNEHEMKAIVNDVAFKSDYFLPGLVEAKQLTGLLTEEEICDFYFSKGTIKAIIIKKGSEGAYYNDGEVCETVSGFKVNEIIDTVGAGDGFAAGFISALLNDKDIRFAVEYANAVGAIQLKHWSDNQGLPTRKELKEFLNNKKEVNNE